MKTKSCAYDITLQLQKTKFVTIMRKGYLLLLLALLLLPTFASAQTLQRDTLNVMFRTGQSEVDLRFGNNEQRITAFVARVLSEYAGVDPKDLSLTIYTGSSPEGPAELNRRLGEQRGMALRDLLLERLGYRILNVTVINQGPRWGALYTMVQQSDEPWRNDVLRILEDDLPGDEWNVDKRERQLRRLKGGRVWQELQEKYLPELRSSGSAIVGRLPEPRPAQRDTLVIRDTVYYIPEPLPLPWIDHRPAIAVGTNLLFDAATIINARAEFSLGTTNHWSIMAETGIAWWLYKKRAYAVEGWMLDVTGRYWLGRRDRHHMLDGWHIDLGAGVGIYDIEPIAHEGWQGRFVNPYAGIGYQHRFGRQKQWFIDGGIAVGYFTAYAHHYLGSSVYPEGYTEPADNHLMWQDTGWKHFLGPTHANITIGYVFTTKQ